MTLSLTMKEPKGRAVLTLKSRKTRFGTRCYLEIEAREGPRVPLFAIRGSQEDGYEPKKDGLHGLALLINELRAGLARDPIQSEVIREAERAGLGGKDTARKLLKEGEGRYWRKQTSGRTVSYVLLET
jgi:hypothetical protein